MAARRWGAVLVVGALLLAACGPPDASAPAGRAPVDGSTSDATPTTGRWERLPDEPPPLDSEPAEVVVALSAERVPVAGAAIDTVVVNRGDANFAYGLAAEVERWDGTRWVLYRRVGDGRLRGLDEEVMVPAEGLGAGPGAADRLIRVGVDGLAPGWYRYVVPGQLVEDWEAYAGRGVPFRAHGRFEVVEAELNLPSFQGWRSLGVDPGAVATDGGRVVLVGTPKEAGTGVDMGDLQRAREATVRIERWEGDWVVALELSADTEPPPPLGNVYEHRLDVPPLEEGLYRVSQTAVGHRDLHGLLLVSALVPPTP